MESWIIEIDKRGINGLSNNTITKIKKYFYFSWSNNWTSISKEGKFFLQGMHKSEAEQLLRIIFRRVLAKFDLFFRNIPSFEDAKSIVCNMKPRIFLPKSVVLNKNSKSNGIYFIVSGSVYLDFFDEDIYKQIFSDASKSNVEFDPLTIVLKEGSFFGEDFLVSMKTSVGFSTWNNQLETLFLPKSKIEEILPDSLTQLQRMTFKRRTVFGEVLFLFKF